MTRPGDRRTASYPPTAEQLRLLTKVARMYHERGIRQPQIARQLGLSQSRVSRLLRQAGEIGVVRTIVSPPSGVHVAIEEHLEARYGLADAIVVDADGAGDNVIPALGAAAATYLGTTLTGGDTIGLAPCSSTLLAAVHVMRARASARADTVVQIVGGGRDPAVQVQATRLTDQLAELTSATPVFLAAPGLTGSAATARAMRKDPVIRNVAAMWDRLTVVLIGIGSLESTPPLALGGLIGPDEQDQLRRLGAVGHICLRFYDEHGRLVRSPLDERTLSITAHALRRVDRKVAVAGGRRKFSAIRGALRGAWVDVLITDLDTARALERNP